MDVATNRHTPVRTDAEGTATTRRSVGRRRETLAAETLRLYAADWARFCDHCAETGRRALPAQADTVIAFLQVPGPGPAARNRRLAAIDHRHRAHALPCPGADATVRRALKQARHTAPRTARPAPPSPASLRAMALRCRGDLAGCRDRALLLLLCCGLSRSTIVGLHAEHLRWSEDGVRVEREKIWVPRLARHDVCPVRALEDWLRASGTRYGPVFRKVTRWGTVEPKALGADAIRLILARHSS